MKPQDLAAAKTAFVFDIDNTLTPPRRQLESSMATALKGLTVPFALAAGSDLALLEHQFFEPLNSFGFRGVFDAFVCNGASRYRCTYQGPRHQLECIDDFSLEKALGSDEYGRLLDVLRVSLRLDVFQLPSPVQIMGEQVVERGSMVNMAPSGRPKGALSAAEHANRDAFVAFDEASGYRKRLLAHLRQQVDRELPGNNLFITFGGQTSFDIGVRGRDKSFAVRQLLAEGARHVTYFGDALYPGGNDVAVLDFLETLGAERDRLKVVRVNGFEDTLRYIEAAAKE